MASTEVYELLAVAGVLIVIVVLVMLFAMRRLHRRKAELLGEIKANPRLNSDRAYNRLEMCRREVAIVARQGTDVAKAQSMIAQAQSAFDLGQSERAYELAQSAHEWLVAARLGQQPLPAAASAAAEPVPSRASPSRAAPATPGRVAGGSSPASAAVVPPPSGLPRNRAESQFEMKLLDSEIESARSSRPSDPPTLAAIEYQTRAHLAFDQGQYTEAFSFALKGRRGLGGNLGTVAPTAGAKPLVPGNGEMDPGQVAERTATASRCPQCGYPTTSEDAFCRGCGTPRTPTACPRCGSPRNPTDTFCGRCGEPFS